MPDEDSRPDTLYVPTERTGADRAPRSSRLNPSVKLTPETVREAIVRGAVRTVGERCPTCTATIRRFYCPQCGEKAPSSRPWSVQAFLQRSVGSFLEADTRFLRSLFLLIRKPGLLTNAYLSGRRKPFMRPMQLFIVVNILFVILAVNVGPDTFRTPLQFHVASSNFYHQQLAEQWVNEAINAPDGWTYMSAQQARASREASGADSTQLSSPDRRSDEAMDRFNAYATRFNKNADSLSETLVLLFIPCLALWFWALRAVFRVDTPRQQFARRDLLADGVHATHTMVALLLTFVATLAILVAVAMSVELGKALVGHALSVPAEPSGLAEVILVLLLVTYLWASFRRRWRISSVLALVGSFATIVVLHQLLLLYRFLLFGLGFALT